MIRFSEEVAEKIGRSRCKTVTDSSLLMLVVDAISRERPSDGQFPRIFLTWNTDFNSQLEKDFGDVNYREAWREELLCVKRLVKVIFCGRYARQ